MKQLRLTEAELKGLLTKREREWGVARVGTEAHKAEERAKNARLRGMLDSVIAPQTRKESPLEVRFVQQLADVGIVPRRPDEIIFKGVLMKDDGERAIFSSAYVRNYLDAVVGRNYELDFAWPQFRFAVEIDGMAHRTKTRFINDYEKHALLQLDGWRVLRVCGKDVRAGRAIEWTKEMLRALTEGQE